MLTGQKGGIDLSSGKTSFYNFLVMVQESCTKNLDKLLRACMLRL